MANDNLNNVALTLVYSGEVAITIDNALSEIKQALQQVRELSIKSVQQRVAVELRNLQKDVDKYLQKIEHMSNQVQINGVRILNGGVELRAVDDSIPSLYFQRIDIASLGLKEFNVTGPRTFVSSSTDLSRPDWLKRQCALFNTTINLTVDGVSCKGLLRVVVDSTDESQDKYKYFMVDDDDINIDVRGRTSGSSIPLTLNIRSADLSFPATRDPLGRPLVGTSPDHFSRALSLKDSNGRPIRNVSANITINGVPSPAELVADRSFNSFVKIAKNTVGNPSNEDKFYPVREGDFVITQGSNALPYGSDSKAKVSLDIRSSDLCSAINNGPLEAIESALVKISRLYDALNALDPEHLERRSD